MKKFAICLMLVAMLPVAVNAGGCAIVAKANVVHHAPVHVVKDVVNVVNVARFVDIPLFNTYIAPPVSYYANPLVPLAQQYAPQAPQAAPCAEALAGFKAMQAKVAELEAKLASKPSKPTAPHMPPAEGNPDPFNPQPQAQQSDSVSRILSARCAACHDEGRAKSAGKGIVLTQGGKAKTFAPEELGAIIASVSTKTMPRGVQMPDAERIELIAALTGAK